MALAAGQAGDGPGTTDDLAAFLEEHPDSDSSTTPPDDDDGPDDDDAPEGEGNEDNPDGENDDSPADDDEDAPEGEDDADENAKPTSGKTFKVTIKGDDGADVTKDVDEKELIAGYMLRADHTRKTQELSTQRAEVMQLAETRVQEGRNFYVQQANVARNAIIALAGIKTPEEMSHLAINNPGEWAAEKQRTEQIQGVLQQIERGLHEDQQQLTKQQEEAQREELGKAWTTLSAEGLDKPKLISIFNDVHRLYGVPRERFQKVTDPALVLIMRDATAFRALKDKAAQVGKKIDKAPAKAPLPQARARVPANEKKAIQINRRFSRPGGAKVGDLAAYIANMKD